MPAITCNIEQPHITDRRQSCRLRFMLPFNAELLLYDDFNICTQVKLEFDALTDMEQRAYLNAVLAEKLSK